MNKIAIFYHTCVNIGTKEHATSIINEQVGLMRSTGLLDAAGLFVVGVNGDESDVQYVASLMPAGAVVIGNPPETWPAGEVQTMRMMRDYSLGNPGQNILYLHMKGLSHVPGSPTHDFNRDWRHGMQNVVIKEWRHCNNLLDLGYESVGNWWNVAPNGSYWAGNFFWAKSEFLATLPPILTDGQNSGGRYEAEVWIGRGHRLPNIVAM